MEKNVKVSVVMPVYNRQQQAEFAARSVLAQDFEDIELIIIDDGSKVPFFLPDDFSKDISITILRQEINQGAGAARNIGIREAKGEYIAFIDSDDIWRGKKLSAQLAFVSKMQNSPDDTPVTGSPITDRHIASTPTVYVCGFTLKSSVTRLQRTLQPISSNRLIDFASGCWFSPGSTALMKRDIFELVGDFDPNLRRFEDIDWYIRFAMARGQLLSVPGTFAEIKAGSKPEAANVMIAKKYLTDKFSNKIGQFLPLNPTQSRHLRSYLALEQASSHSAHKEWIGFLAQIALSWILKPRLRLHLNNWWHLSNSL